MTPAPIDRVLSEPTPGLDAIRVDPDPDMTALLTEPVPPRSMAEIVRDMCMEDAELATKTQVDRRFRLLPGQWSTATA